MKVKKKKVSVRSGRVFCDHSLFEIAGSNPAGVMDVCLFWPSCVVSVCEFSATGRSLIQRSLTACGVSECHLGTSALRTPSSARVLAPWKAVESRSNLIFNPHHHVLSYPQFSLFFLYLTINFTLKKNMKWRRCRLGGLWRSKGQKISSTLQNMQFQNFRLSRWNILIYLLLWIKPTRSYAMVYWTLWIAQHVSGITMPIIRSLRL